MLSLGAGGELLVARLRALLSLLILAMPLIAALGGAKSGEVVIGLGLGVFTNLMAQIWLVLARRQLRYSWLSYATSPYDSTEDHTSELQSLMRTSYAAFCLTQ